MGDTRKKTKQETTQKEKNNETTKTQETITKDKPPHMIDGMTKSKIKKKSKHDEDLETKTKKSVGIETEKPITKDDEESQPTNTQDKIKSKKKQKKKLKHLDSSDKPISSSTTTTNLNEIIKPVVVDTELDSLFKSSKFTPLEIPANPVVENQSKDDTKITKPIKQNKVSNSEQKKTGKNEKFEQEEEKGSGINNGSLEISYELKLAIQRAKEISKQLKPDSNTSPPPPKVESKKKSIVIQKENKNETNLRDKQDSSDDDQPLIHETSLRRDGTTRTKSNKTTKLGKIESNESSEQLNSRTIFIGNVPIDCVTEKSARQSLMEHILNPLKEEKQLASKSRIETVRFRGIPLAEPIADEPRANEKAIKRAKAWQEAQAESLKGFDDETGGRAGRRGAKPLKSTDSTPAPPVQFLTPGQKRKIGYVTGNLHPEAKSCIAYIVIAHIPEGVSQDESNNLSAKELAELIVTKADGTNLLGHVLRCDIARGGSSKTKTTQMTCSITLDEQRRTLFIGGLDFVEDEDAIRTAVENKLLEEKVGLPDDATTWVERVRVIRDKATSLNKGFAYVLLRTQNAVEELLALPEESFKIGKRKVRLEKYLSTGQASALKKIQDSKWDQKKSSNNNKQKSNQGQEPKKKKFRIDLSKEIETKYKGPDLSKTLAGLTKSQRKEIKSNNQLRVERRMLKKQNKIKLNILKNSNNKHDINSLSSSMKPVRNKFKKNLKKSVVKSSDPSTSSTKKSTKIKNKKIVNK